jgi:hypothetical protein
MALDIAYCDDLLKSELLLRDQYFTNVPSVPDRAVCNSLVPTVHQLELQYRAA